MGFFSDLKEDLSQAVNELMPDEVKLNQDVVQPQEQETDFGDEALQPVESLDDMLARVDTIQVSEELMAAQDEEAVLEEDADGEEEMDEDEDYDLLQADVELPESGGEQEEDYFKEIDGIQDQEDFREEDTEGDDQAFDEDVTEDMSMDLESMLAGAFGAESMAADRQQEESKGADKEMETGQNRVAIDETAVITAGMTINGDISSEGSIEVIGSINGNIEALGKLNITGYINGNSRASEIFADSAKITGEVVSEGAVKIGASSVIIGNISATSAVIAGAVKGDIDVQGPVILDTSAIVMGNIKSKSVQINNGAVIEGMCSQCYAEVSPTSFFDEYKPETRKGRTAKNK